MRSLNVDGFRISMLGLLLVMAFMVLWLAWFALAQVTLYEVSETANLASSRAVADFPATALWRVRPGQSAQVYLDGFPRTQVGAVPATVARVAGEIHDGRVQVELILYPDPDFPILLQPGLTGVAEVQVERVSPATLVLRAAGQLLAAPPANGDAER